MKRYRVGEFVEPPIEERDGEWIRYSDHVNALATIRDEARRAAFKEVIAVVKQYAGSCPGHTQLQMFAALEAAEEGERDAEPLREA